MAPKTSLPSLSRFSRWLIKKIFRDDDGARLGDFLEVYHGMAQKGGTLTYRIRFAVYLLKSIPQHFRNQFSRRGTMSWNNIKVATRNLIKYKGYSMISLAGLTLGLTSFILISLYVRYEFQFDGYHANSDRIYRIINHQPEKNLVNSDYFAWTQGPLGPTLMERYPEVEAATRLDVYNKVLLTQGEKSHMEDDFYFADPEISQIFSYEMIYGSALTELEKRHSLFLSRKMSEKYFGTRDPVGEVIQFRDSRFPETVEFVIAGVFENMPYDSHIRMEFIASFKMKLEIEPLNEANWTPGWYCYTYCLLQKGADPDALESKLTHLSAEVFEKNQIESRLVLQPLHKIHLYSQINGEISPNGNIKYVYLFSAIALLILIIACINYMNLGTARSVQREKEVAIRKVIGARKGQLIRQYLGESMILAAISLILSLMAIQIILPVFNTFFDRHIAFSLMADLKWGLFLMALVILTGTASGSYPAFMLSSFEPVRIIRGKAGRVGKGAGLRQLLVVFQFAVSIILIISSMVVNRQLRYIQNKDVGYERERIVVLTLRDGSAVRELNAVKTELLRNPLILAAAGSITLPNNIKSFSRFPQPGSSDESLLTLYTGQIDADFIDLYGLKIIQGRNFSNDFPSDNRDAVIINEAAAKVLGWKSPLGQRLRHRGSRDPEIIGIVQDFNFHSLHHQIAPLCFYKRDTGFYLSLKIRGNDIPDTLKFIESKMKIFSPEYPLEYRFIDDLFDQAYREERKLGSLVMTFTGIAVFIACLGLLGLATHTAVQRTKEIGIRKVLGAPVAGIIMLLSKQFLIWILIASAIAWPAAFFIMRGWLNNFAYRTGLGIGTFSAATAVALIIALLTISRQSLKSASADPVKSLRHE